jgi:hypothetical protein
LYRSEIVRPSQTITRSAAIPISRSLRERKRSANVVSVFGPGPLGRSLSVSLPAVYSGDISRGGPWSLRGGDWWRSGVLASSPFSLFPHLVSNVSRVSRLLSFFWIRLRWRMKVSSPLSVCSYAFMIDFSFNFYGISVGRIWLIFR